MKHLILYFLVMTNVLFAVDRDTITDSGLYYFGTGISENVREARDQALAELTSQIAVKVQNSFSAKIKESDTGLTESVEAVLQSYSTAALRNVQSKTTMLEDGRFEVFSYIEKSEVTKIFSSRKNLIADMVAIGEKYRNEGNISFALKQFYYAGILVLSLPDENVVIGGRNYTTAIPGLINETIHKTEFRFKAEYLASDKERNITLDVTFDGKPVSLIDFTFWDGTRQVAVQGRNGMAIFALYGASVEMQKLSLQMQYSFYENRREYAPVADLWDLVERPIFKARKMVSLQDAEASAAAGTEEKISDSGIALEGCREAIELKFDGTAPPSEALTVDACKFLAALRQQSAQELPDHMQKDDYLMAKTRAYLKHNQPSLPQAQSASVHRTDIGFEVRRLAVTHRYPSIPKQSTEFLVLDFDSSGQMVDFNVTISDNLYDRFVREAEYGKDWGNRQNIIKFLEKYRSAYLIRDIETVDMMFAEEALIIIGRKIKKKELPADRVKYQQFGDQPDIEYLRLTKEEYLKRQNAVFRSQQDLFLDFGSFDIIKKANAPGVYGVEMRQSYASTTYADEGYLFLLIDFAEEDPMIYVRAWQPETWSDDELIKTANFRIYK
jgi:hypothetical protein